MLLSVDASNCKGCVAEVKDKRYQISFDGWIIIDGHCQGNAYHSLYKIIIIIKEFQNIELIKTQPQRKHLLKMAKRVPLKLI